jgi:DNA-binding CsgD family transcriptional regulator
LHRRIARTVSDSEERARHYALAADRPDTTVASALDDAVEQASRRGARTAAAELAELAVKLTPRDEVTTLRTRRLVLAEHEFLAGDVTRSRRILERLVDELPPGTERARALLDLAETRSGDLNAMLPLREQAVVEAARDDRVLEEGLRLLAATLFVAGRPGEALVRAGEAVAAAERTGNPRLLAMSSAYLAWLEIWRGSVTPGLLERALALEEDSGYLRLYESPALVEGLRAMYLDDDLNAARARLMNAEGIARDHGDDECRAVVLPQLVQVECRAGRFDDAARYAAESLEIREQFGLGTGAHLYEIARAAALSGRIAGGDLDWAATQLEDLNETAGLGIAYAQARAARCQGLLAAARRDYDAAMDAFHRTLAIHDRLPDPLERGRTWLALGQTQRRAGRRRDARVALREALSIFEAVGATLWAEQARNELERLGGKTPSGGALTGAEERVARLVAEGKTNREVAAALFVAERTVETHLSSIYRKLELRSRSELARHLAVAADEQNS